MTNYGPPLRFKAVDTETGRELGCDDLLDPVLIGGDGSHGVEYSVFYECYAQNRKSINSITLYQSTGHTDANGVEVFFGDKLLDQYGKIWTVQVDDEFRPIIHADHEPFDNHRVYFVRDFVVLGNIHTPPAELQRRAEGVRGEIR